MYVSDELRAALDAMDESLLLVTTDARIVHCTSRAAKFAFHGNRRRLADPAILRKAGILKFLSRCATSPMPLKGVLELASPQASGTARFPCLGLRVRVPPGSVLVLLRFESALPPRHDVYVGFPHDRYAGIHQAERTERERIARDLHDQAGQNALCLKLGLGQLRNLCAKRAALAKIDELMQQVDTVVENLHRAIVDLRPSAFEGQDLTEALKAVSDQWSRYTGIPVIFNTEGRSFPLNERYEAALFRILQEALTNIAKHATGVREVDVILRYSKGCATLMIQDDGRGLREADQSLAILTQHGKLGLVGMHERMACLGGELELRNAGGRGCGTTIVARTHRAKCRTIGPAHAG